MTSTIGTARFILLLDDTSEIGLVIIAEFLEKGPAKVILASLPNGPLHETSAEEMKAAGASEVVILGFDATDPDSHPEVVDKAPVDGNVDIYIVAFGMFGDAEGLWQNQCKAVLATNINYIGTVSMGILADQKPKAQDHDQFIAIPFIASEHMRCSNSAYGSIRADLDGFYLNLGEALEEYGMKALVIRPGQIRTHMSADVDETPPTMNKGDVAGLVVKSVEADKILVWTPPAFQLVMMVLEHIPRPVFKKLPI